MRCSDPWSVLGAAQCTALAGGKEQEGSSSNSSLSLGD
jgi:hypothetical protein